MARENFEYFAGYGGDCIGASDITPGMREKLRNHDIPAYEFETIVIRRRKGGEIVEVIKPVETTGFPA